MNKNKEVLDLAQLIKMLRNKRGLSQKKLAQISGLSSTTITRIENGETRNPDGQTLKLLATHLGCAEAQLIDLVEAYKNPSNYKKKAVLKFLQQPVRRIKRYSSVMTNVQEIEIEQEYIEDQQQFQPQAVAALQEKDVLPNSEPEIKINLKGMRLITLRMERNTTQKELADALGMDKTLISQYEGEIIKPDYPTVQRLADFFGVDVSYLAGESTEEIIIKEAPKVIFKEELIVKPLPKRDLRPEYLAIAEEIQAAGIEVEDVRAFIEMVKKYKRI